MVQQGFEIREEMTYKVSADTLWKIVGPGFADVHEWSSNVDFTTGKGLSKIPGAPCSERICDVNVKGFGQVSETLMAYDAEAMSLAYEANLGMPSWVTLAANRWTVQAIDNQTSRLVMEAEFKTQGLMGWMMNGLMNRKLNKTIQTVLLDLKSYVETGKVSRVKQARLDELAARGVAA